MRRPILACLSFALAFACAVPPVNASGIAGLLSGAEPLRIAGLRVNREALREVYAANAFQPLWNERDRLRLRERLRRAGEDGLDPKAYRLERFDEARTLAAGRGDPRLELLLTDALLRYAADLADGRPDSRRADPAWEIAGPRIDPVAAARAATGAEDPVHALAALAPPHAGYARLRETLAQYRRIAADGGWTVLPDGPLVHPGGTGPSIPLLRRRLSEAGDLDEAELEGDRLDETLVAALRRFQARHGLLADGILGPNSRSALNTPVERRIEQILANMERWRWLPRELEPTRVMVNVAGADLELVEDDVVVLSSRVVVGRPSHPTPSFRSPIVSIVLNPAWNIPHSIAAREMLPALRRNPDYLRTRNIRIRGLPADAPEAWGLGVDWEGIETRRFPFRLQQLPGPGNALGRLKFQMINGHDIYLHDTPQRHLFESPRRGFSHGCVRVENPLGLAERLLGQGWPAARLRRLIADGDTRIIRLPNRVPVYTVYFTAWVTPEGVLHFRDDLYGRDALMG